MSLIDYFKNLFKHQKINTNAELVRPIDIIKMPKREEFNNDDLIDYYKNEYSNILSTMKDYDTLILEADELNYRLKMTSELLFDISMKEDGAKEKSIEDRINYLINIEKFELYYKDITELQKEISARLIAISEIKKEFFLSKKKKETINNIINRLSLSLNVLYSIEVGLINNIERYKSESTDNYFPNDEEKKEEYKVVNAKIKHFNWLQQILDSDKQINIRTDVNYLFKDLALLEKNLEEYTYIHRKEITEESKNKEIEEILQIPFDVEHKKELLNKIVKTEIKYRAFYEYKEHQENGNIVVDESDLTSIYNLKFSAIIISDQVIIEPLEVEDEIEIEYYKKIIFSIIQNILLGQNLKFNEIFSDYLKEAINMLKEVLKWDKNKIDCAKILQNKYLLNLLLIIDRGEDLNTFYQNFKVSTIENYDIGIQNSNGYMFKLENKIPLSTYFLFRKYLSLHLLRKKEGYNSILNDYYDSYIPVNEPTLAEFYQLYEKVQLKLPEYHMPEGITEIKCNEDLSVPCRDIFEKIRKDAANKIVYLPSSLKKIEGDSILSNMESKLKGVFLNEGLESINCRGYLFDENLDVLSIPSTLQPNYYKKFLLKGFFDEHEKLDKLVYTNFSDMNHLYFPEELFSFEILDLHRIPDFFDAENSPISRGNYSSIYYNAKLKVRLNIKEFIFYFNNNEKMIIPTSEFDYLYEGILTKDRFNHSSYYLEKVGDIEPYNNNYYKIYKSYIENFKNVLKEKLELNLVSIDEKEITREEGKR